MLENWFNERMVVAIWGGLLFHRGRLESVFIAFFFLRKDNRGILNKYEYLQKK